MDIALRLRNGGLRAVRTVMEARAIEAKAAESFWTRWYGTQIKFKGRNVPDHWRVFGARMVKRSGGKLGEKPAQLGARYAICPANAALNYALNYAFAYVSPFVYPAAGLGAAASRAASRRREDTCVSGTRRTDVTGHGCVGAPCRGVGIAKIRREWHSRTQTRP
jgi:hypothetical protein